jgi:hypothetical protein
MLQVFIDPFNEVILEYTFDELVKNIGREELVYVSTREAMCEWLGKQ